MAKTLSHLSDEELLRLMLAGDGDAFEALYDRRQGGVYRFALRMSGSADLAEDVTHDVFIALMRDGGQFDPSRGSVAAYLLGIARHCALKRLRRERSFVSISEGSEEGEDANPTARRLETITRHIVSAHYGKIRNVSHVMGGAISESKPVEVEVPLELAQSIFCIAAP